MSDGAGEHILTELDSSVLTVTLNRPDRLNAVTLEMLDDLRRIFLEADANDDVRAVVVTGRGRAFCAGADLSQGAARFDYRAAGIAPDEHRDQGGQVTLAVHACRKPVIGAINGAAVGFGASFILGMDVRLGSTAARVGYVYARRGIVPEGVASWFLPRVVGMPRALEWISTGRTADANECWEAGLLRSLYEPDGLLPAAYALAGEIAANTSAVSVAAGRAMLWRGLAASDPMEAHLLESRMMWERGSSADAVEGVASFTDKRPPRFPGRVSQEFPELLR